jgi:hypothetical protein
MFVTTVLILALIVLVVGVVLDWFAIHTDSREVGEQDEWRLSFVVNPQQFNESVAAVGQELEELSQKAEALRKSRSIQAVVDSVDAEQRRLTVTDEKGETRVFTMDKTTEIQLNDKSVTLTDLAPRDKVTVLVRENEGERTVLSVEAERPDADEQAGDAVEPAGEGVDVERGAEDGAPRD